MGVFQKSGLAGGITARPVILKMKLAFSKSHC